MMVTSVSIETLGAHDHVWIWIDGKQVGKLVVSKGDGEALETLLLAGSAGIEPNWLVKDFKVLYRAAQHVVDDPGASVGNLRAQLTRLERAFELTEGVHRRG